ncbi:MAG: hypothetical protein CMM73_04515 [Rhodospirillaceae bacterium]|nr:hypothetical protein [Rhodospirillaceae bacterium]|tara:strand:- start:900 stop:1256 length:357 start_codon:yes stop_codon:yes gene_type:complete
MRFFGRLAWSFISLLAVILAMLFATSNTQTVTLRLWPLEGTFGLAVWIIVLGAAATGALFGGGLVWLSLVAAKARNWRLQRRLGKAEKRAVSAEAELDAVTSDTAPSSSQATTLPSRQ